MRQLRQELIEFLLAIGQFPTAAVVDAEAVHDTVNDEEAVFVGCKIRGESVQQFQLVLKKRCELGKSEQVCAPTNFTVKSTTVGYVFLCLVRIHCPESETFQRP